MQRVTQRAAWGLVFVFAAVGAASADPIKKSLDEWKTAYAQVMDAAGKKLNEGFKSAVQAVAGRGDLDAVKALVAQQEAFEKSGQLPTHTAMKPAVDEYLKTRDDSRKALLDAYTKAISDYTKAGDAAKAAAVRKNKVAFESGKSPAKAPKADRVTNSPTKTPTTPLKGDPNMARLNVSIKQHADVAAKARAQLVAAIDDAIQTANTKGNAQEAQLLTDAKQRIVTDGQPPADVPSLRYKLAKVKYDRDMAAANKTLAGAYRLAIARYKRVRDAAMVKALEVELAKLDAGSTGSSASTTRGRRIDLLKLIDLDKHAKPRDKWDVVRGKLTCVKGSFVPKIILPYMPPKEYDYRIVFEPLELRNPICHIMPNGATWFTWQMGERRGTQAFFSVNGSSFRNPTRVDLKQPLQVNRQFESIVRVRKDGVQAFLNGKLVAEHKTDFTDMRASMWFNIKAPGQLGFSADDPCVFHAVEVIEVSGKGKFLR